MKTELRTVKYYVYYERNEKAILQSEWKSLEAARMAVSIIQDDFQGLPVYIEMVTTERI